MTCCRKRDRTARQVARISNCHRSASGYVGHFATSRGRPRLLLDRVRKNQHCADCCNAHSTSEMGQTATKRHIRIKSGSLPITDITLACPAPSPRGGVCVTPPCRAPPSGAPRTPRTADDRDITACCPRPTMRCPECLRLGPRFKHSTVFPDGVRGLNLRWVGFGRCSLADRGVAQICQH
jgi:hypothetical protein